VRLLLATVMLSSVVTSGSRDTRHGVGFGSCPFAKSATIARTKIDREMHKGSTLSFAKERWLLEQNTLTTWQVLNGESQVVMATRCGSMITMIT
jgi:hypothetical protein